MLLGDPAILTAHLYGWQARAVALCASHDFSAARCHLLCSVPGSKTGAVHRHL
jgi:hypothetical protein